MANTKNPRPLEPVLAEVIKAGFPPDGTFVRAIRDLLTRADKILTDKGEVQSAANVTGRNEPLGTTLQNVDAAGTILAAGVDLSRAYLNKTVDNINDGTSFVRTTPNEKTGAGRGFNALDSNSRIVNSFALQPLDVSVVPLSSTTLSNPGGGPTAITIAASSMQYGAGSVAYNSGSVDPGSTGTYYVYASDPTFAGGAITYLASTFPYDQTTSDASIPFGKITVSGAASTGGGYQGGLGARGGRGYVQ